VARKGKAELLYETSCAHAIDMNGAIYCLNSAVYHGLINDNSAFRKVEDDVASTIRLSIPERKEMRNLMDG
jgi:hypothetical protein